MSHATFHKVLNDSLEAGHICCGSGKTLWFARRSVAGGGRVCRVRDGMYGTVARMPWPALGTTRSVRRHE